MMARADEPGPHVVVVGSGIAGLTAARHAAATGCRVTVVTKDVLEHANTRFAQGGIAGVMFEDDSVAAHVRDTLAAGAGLCDPGAVRVLAEEGPRRIRDLIALGVAFDRGEDGVLSKGLEAAHSYPRVLHAGGDATGAVIEAALVAQLRESRVAVVEHAFLVDLVTAQGRVIGVDLLVDDRERRRVACDAVVLATGGAGQLYPHTTNPQVATGDGIAAAMRAGAAVADLEFFQFHPTVLPGDDRAGSFLVSEAVRGEGATLLDRDGERFLAGIHPAAELAPRDVVARAIATEMIRQHDAPVLLDATRLRADPAETAAFLARRFPTIDAAVRERGIDWARSPIPVTPAAHYLMGGVVVDLHGRTSVPGLYAVGEVARTGVHGANRLASNSLLEGAVFGARAGDALRADVASGTWPVSGTTTHRAELPPPSGAPATEAFSRAALQRLMWDHAGLVRDGAGLEHAGATIAAWLATRPRLGETTGEAEFEDANLLLVAAHLVAAAAARRTSVGAHFRSDDTDARPAPPVMTTRAAFRGTRVPSRKVPA